MNLLSSARFGDLATLKTLLNPSLVNLKKTAEKLKITKKH